MKNVLISVKYIYIERLKLPRKLCITSYNSSNTVARTIKVYINIVHLANKTLNCLFLV